MGGNQLQASTKILMFMSATVVFLSCCLHRLKRKCLELQIGHMVHIKISLPSEIKKLTQSLKLIDLTA